MKNVPLTSNASVLFLPIKPIFLDRILSGEKKFEFRKTEIQRDVEYILLYASSPTCRILGYAKLDYVTSASPGSIWRRTKANAGISWSDFKNYYANRNTAVSFALKCVTEFCEPVITSTVDPEFRIPQSFCYVDIKFLKKVLRLGDKIERIAA